MWARRQVDKEHRSGLYLAAENNHLRCVKTLLKTGVRAELLNRNDRWDNTALHIASIRGHLDIVTALIEAGAQIDNKNEDEQTPLHVAAKHGKLIFLRKLMYCTFNFRTFSSFPKLRVHPKNNFFSLNFSSRKLT